MRRAASLVPYGEMKFGKQLERHKIRGWDDYYVDYNALKRSLKDCACKGDEVFDKEAQARG